MVKKQALPWQGCSPRLLILSVSAGSGHVRAAKAIENYVKESCPESAVRHLDVMDYAALALRLVYVKFYAWVIRHTPSLWRIIYQRSDRFERSSIWSRLRGSIQCLNTRRLFSEIDQFDPDVIICTHFLPAELVSRSPSFSGRRVPVWVVVTDYDLHSAWIQEGVTGYFVAHEEMREQLHRLGVPRPAIHISGIPIMPAFWSTAGRDACRMEFGIPHDRPAALLLTNGFTPQAAEGIVEALLAPGTGISVIVLLGKDAATAKACHLMQRRYGTRLSLQGYTNCIERLMACSDVVITKPGGLTVSECLATRLPMVLFEPIPGQEERNADYLLEQGVALKAANPEAVAYRVRRILSDPAIRGRMTQRAGQIQKIFAVRTVVAEVTRHASFFSFPT